jgi:hypothetical protein
MAVDYSSSGQGGAFTQNFYLLHQEFGQTPVAIHHLAATERQ